MSDPRLTDLDAWVAQLMHTSVLLELAALSVCAALAWALVWLLARSIGQREINATLFGRNRMDGVLFPMLWVVLAYAARPLLLHWMPLAVFKIALPVLLALLAIRLSVKVLQVAFHDTPWIHLLERSISWLVWLGMVLWVSGLLPVVLEELDQITLPIGGGRLSVRTLIEGALTAGVVLIVTLWISALIESRLLRQATGSELSLRKAASNATRVTLMTVGLLVALSSVGVDLTTLSVLGGAIGVGVGFGLQKLAANYVSGFVILAERSMRIGDSVRVDGFAGCITEINARYTVIRALNGTESIVPNELLLTCRVENLSLSNSLNWQSTTVSVAYDSDVGVVMELLKQAALNHARVLQDPAPSVTLTAFGADGLEFKLGYWVNDPENGSDNLKSLINLDILSLLRSRHITIPYPQRVVQLHLSQTGAGT